MDKTKNGLMMLALIAMIVTGICSCKKSSSTYANQLKAEKKLIDNYVSRNELQIVDYLPSDSEFLANPKLYYEFPSLSRCYYRLDVVGDKTTDSIRVSQTAIMRYKQYELTENADTTSNWSSLDSPFALEFPFWTDMYASSPISCTAWNYAVLYMRYNDSECRIIVPSKYGFSSEKNSVTPMGYTLRLKFHP